MDKDLTIAVKQDVQKHFVWAGYNAKTGYFYIATSVTIPHAEPKWIVPKELLMPQTVWKERYWRVNPHSIEVKLVPQADGRFEHTQHSLPRLEDFFKGVEDDNGNKISNYDLTSDQVAVASALIDYLSLTMSAGEKRSLPVVWDHGNPV